MFKLIIAVLIVQFIAVGFCTGKTIGPNDAEARIIEGYDPEMYIDPDNYDGNPFTA